MHPRQYRVGREMKVALPQNAVGKLTRCRGNVLLAAGVGMLGYCAYVLGDTWMYQRQASQLFDRAHLQVGAIPRPGYRVDQRIAGTDGDTAAGRFRNRC